MLVLSRKVGERIQIGENISVMVVRIAGGGVRLGVEAPPEMTVMRHELHDRRRVGTTDKGQMPVGRTDARASDDATTRAAAVDVPRPNRRIPAVES